MTKRGELRDGETSGMTKGEALRHFEASGMAKDEGVPAACTSALPQPPRATSFRVRAAEPGMTPREAYHTYFSPFAASLSRMP